MVAGALSLQDGARVVALRSQLVRRHLAGRGGMATVEIGHDEVARRLEASELALSIAVINTLTSTVVH